MRLDALLGVLFILLIASAGHADEVSITTFYPSPNAVYKEFESTGTSKLATDGESFVGIGTANPVTELDIRHTNPASANKSTLWSLSGGLAQRTAFNLFTQGSPVSKSISGLNRSAWQIISSGDEFLPLWKNRLLFEFHLKGAGLNANDKTLHLDPSGSVTIAPVSRGLSLKNDLNVTGMMAVGDTSVDFNATTISHEYVSYNPPSQLYQSYTRLKPTSVPNEGVQRHLYNFQTRDESDASVKKTIADVLVDGKMIAGEDLMLQSTNHFMSQTGFVTGTYQGTANTKTIALGFRPRFVQIWGAVQTIAGSNTNYVTSGFEKTLNMPGGWAVYSFSENNHVGNPIHSTRNENTFGRTYTYYYDWGLTLTSDGFQVTGTNDTTAGFYQTNGLDPSGNSIQYFYLARR